MVWTFAGSQLKGDEKSLLAYVRMAYWIDVRDRITKKVGKDGRIAFSDALEILEEPTSEAVNSFYESLGSEQHQALSAAWNRAVEILQAATQTEAYKAQMAEQEKASQRRNQT